MNTAICRLMGLALGPQLPPLDMKRVTSSDCLQWWLQARAGLMLQEPSAVRFLHVAMLQHDPEGRAAFMHRTAEGKFYPNRYLLFLHKTLHARACYLKPIRPSKS